MLVFFRGGIFCSMSSNFPRSSWGKGFFLPPRRSQAPTSGRSSLWVGAGASSGEAAKLPHRREGECMQQAQPARLRACWRTKNNTTSTFFRLIDECDVECCFFFLQIGAGTSPGEAAQLELRREGDVTPHTQLTLSFTCSLFCACTSATSHTPHTRH